MPDALKWLLLVLLPAQCATNLLSDHLAGLFVRYGHELPAVRSQIRAVAKRGVMARTELDDFEAELLYLWVRDHRPKVVFEISPASGYSSLWIVHALRRNGAGHCHAFDIEDNSAANMQEWREEWSFHLGDATSITKWPVPLGDVGLVLLDSEHSARFARWFTGALLQPIHDAAAREGRRVAVLNHDFYHRDRPIGPESQVVLEWLQANKLEHWSGAPVQRQPAEPWIWRHYVLAGLLDLEDVVGATKMDNEMAFFWIGARPSSSCAAPLGHLSVSSKHQAVLAPVCANASLVRAGDMAFAVFTQGTALRLVSIAARENQMEALQTAVRKNTKMILRKQSKLRPKPPPARLGSDVKPGSTAHMLHFEASQPPAVDFWFKYRVEWREESVELAALDPRTAWGQRLLWAPETPARAAEVRVSTGAILVNSHANVRFEDGAPKAQLQPELSEPVQAQLQPELSLELIYAQPFRALALLEAQQASQPSNLQALYNLAVFLLDAGLVRRGLELMERCVRGLPHAGPEMSTLGPLAIPSLAEYFMESGRVADAIALLEAALTATPQLAGRNSMGHMLLIAYRLQLEQQCAAGGDCQRIHSTVLRAIQTEWVVMNAGVNNLYNGFVPPSQWQIHNFHDMPSHDRFRMFVSSRTPFVIRGSMLAAMGWKAQHWTAEHMIDALADSPRKYVHVMTKNQTDAKPFMLGGPLSSDTHRRLVSWEGLVNAAYSKCSGSTGSKQFELGCSETQAAYFAIQPNIDQYDSDTYEFPLNQPKLRADIPLPSLIPKQAHTSSNIWFGAGAVSQDGCLPVHTHLHADPMDNVYVLVKGKKKFRIYDPSQTQAISLVSPPTKVSPQGKYEFDQSRSSTDRFSKVPGQDFYDDDEGYQRAVPGWCADCEATEVELNEGEMLYLPQGWFHDVLSTCSRGSRSHLAVNHWFEPGVFVDFEASE